MYLAGRTLVVVVRSMPGVFNDWHDVMVLADWSDSEPWESGRVEQFSAAWIDAQWERLA